jgi:hypothetical protein
MLSGDIARPVSRSIVGYSWEVAGGDPEGGTDSAEAAAGQQ